MTRAAFPKLLAQLRAVTAALTSLKNIVIDPQQDVLHQDRKAVAFLAPSCPVNTEDVPICFHPCLAFKSRERWKKDFEANLDSLRRACAGKDKCACLAEVTCSALTAFYDPAVQPPKHSQRLQGEPNGLSGVLRTVHPSPRAGLLNWLAKNIRAPQGLQEV